MQRKRLLALGFALVLVTASVFAPRCSSGDSELIISPDTVEVMGVPGTGLEPNEARIEGAAQPPLPTPRVLVSVTHTESAGLWTYTYTVLVQSNSPLDVGSFTLQGLAPNCQHTGPVGWKDLPQWRGPDGLRWYARMSPQEEVVLSPYRIPAGQSRVFVLRSFGAPGAVTFACEGEVAEVVHATEEEAAAAYEARGGDNAGPFQYAEIGTTYGPVGSGVGSCEGGGGGDEPPIELPPPHGGSSFPDPDSLIAFGFPQPNPHREGRQTILFRLKVGGSVQVVVYDVAGRRVAEPLKEDLRPGMHSLVWRGHANDGSALPSGTYYFQFYFNGKAMGSRGTVLLR